MHEKLPVKMRVPRVFGVHLTQYYKKSLWEGGGGGAYRKRGVPGLVLGARGGTQNFVVPALDFVCNLDDTPNLV